MWRILVATALATDPDGPEAAFTRARDAELHGRWDEVATTCAELRAAWPEDRRAADCARRQDWLDRRRDADGTLRGFLVLEQARRSELPDPGPAVESVRTAAASSVVTEADASAWLARRALDGRDAPGALALLDGIGPLPPEEAALAGAVDELRAEALAGVGREDEALDRDAEVAARVILDRRRRALARAAAAAVALFGCAVAPFLGGWRDAGPPRGLVPIALGFAGAGGLATAWEAGSAAAVPWALAGALAVHALALPALLALRRAPWPRRVVRGLAALATVALAYLAAWWTETLPWVGL